VEHYSYVPVFWGFGLMPLVCAAIFWSLLGPIEFGAAGLGLERVNGSDTDGLSR